MKIAIPYFQGRISPVFDVAGHFYLIEVKDGKELSRQEFDFIGNGIFAKAQMLSELNVDVLICGAISGIQENVLRNTGIRLLTFICGEMEDVLEAFVYGKVAIRAFQMPGCCGRRRHRHGYRGEKYNHW
jgi:predicted Fe-Mo cluster-binding NifX family protein